MGINLLGEASQNKIGVRGRISGLLTLSFP